MIRPALNEPSSNFNNVNVEPLLSKISKDLKALNLPIDQKFYDNLNEIKQNALCIDLFIGYDGKHIRKTLTDFSQKLGDKLVKYMLMFFRLLFLFKF